jgi:exodeoxyribonuclease VIII
MQIHEKQWELQTKCFYKLSPDLVEKIKEVYKTLEENNFTGIFKFDDDVYHYGIGIAKGRLDKFRKSPLKYLHAHVNPQLEDVPDPFKIGEMVHRAVLEPGALMNKYVSDETIYKASGSRLKKDYKEAKAAIESSGKYVINYEDFSMANTMIQKVFSHEKLQNILKKGQAEKCIYARDPETGLIIRCKPDYMFVSDGINFDLKTTKDASMEEFSKSIWNYRYHAQAAYYNLVCTLATGIDFKYFIFGCLEKEEPYDIALYYIDDGALDKGETEIRQDLNNYANAIETNNFPGYSRDIEAISLPYWTFGRE